MRLRCEGDDLLISVRDSGPGVPAGVGNDVFEDGFSTKPAPAVGRRGLGLALVRQIAHRHGGEVRLAEPRPGEGACFDVVLRDMFEVGAACDQDLADAGKVEFVPCYGAPGRPEHHYRWVG